MPCSTLSLVSPLSPRTPDKGVVVTRATPVQTHPQDGDQGEIVIRVLYHDFIESTKKTWSLDSGYDKNLRALRERRFFSDLHFGPSDVEAVEIESLWFEGRGPWVSRDWEELEKNKRTLQNFKTRSCRLQSSVSAALKKKLDKMKLTLLSQDDVRSCNRTRRQPWWLVNSVDCRQWLLLLARAWPKLCTVSNASSATTLVLLP